MKENFEIKEKKDYCNADRKTRINNTSCGNNILLPKPQIIKEFTF